MSYQQELYSSPETVSLKGQSQKESKRLFTVSQRFPVVVGVPLLAAVGLICFCSLIVLFFLFTFQINYLIKYASSSHFWKFLPRVLVLIYCTICFRDTRAALLAQYLCLFPLAFRLHRMLRSPGTFRNTCMELMCSLCTYGVVFTLQFMHYSAPLTLLLIHLFCTIDFAVKAPMVHHWLCSSCTCGVAFTLLFRRLWCRNYFFPNVSVVYYSLHSLSTICVAFTLLLMFLWCSVQFVRYAHGVAFTFFPVHL